MLIKLNQSMNLTKMIKIRKLEKSLEKFSLKKIRKIYDKNNMLYLEMFPVGISYSPYKLCVFNIKMNRITNLHNFIINKELDIEFIKKIKKLGCEGYRIKFFYHEVNLQGIV